jgi:glycine betaine/proline transport system ATP-binding protein
MQPIEKFVSAAGQPPSNAPRVDENASLSELIKLAIDDDAPIVVLDKGAEVGVITRPDILQTVIDGAETS